MKLRAISHSRTGDKGTILNVSLFEGDVVRYEMPTIGALNFVLHGRIGGGVTRTLALDVHGKSLSSALLEMEIPDEDGNAQP